MARKVYLGFERLLGTEKNSHLASCARTGLKSLGGGVHLPNIERYPRTREISDSYREDLIEPSVLGASSLKLDSIQSSRARDQRSSRVTVNIGSVIHLYHRVCVDIEISQSIDGTKVSSDGKNCSCEWLAGAHRLHLLRSSCTFALGA